MKKNQIIILATFLLCFCQKSNAQESNVSKSVTKLNILFPGLSHEMRLGNNQTAYFGLSFNPVGEYDSQFISNNKDVKYSLYPVAQAEVRQFYNLTKRANNGLNTNRNSGNYLALRGLGIFPSVLSKNDQPQQYPNGLGVAGIVWGIQRNYPSGFSLGLSIGTGFKFSNGNTARTGLFDFSLGFQLGGKE
jgi:hypothetical protein